jgi:hypothetical protein
MAGNDGMRPDRGALADLDMTADDRIRADFDIPGQSRAILDDCGWMDTGHVTYS